MYFNLVLLLMIIDQAVWMGWDGWMATRYKEVEED